MIVGQMLVALMLSGPLSAAPTAAGSAADIYREMNLKGVLEESVFTAGFESMQRHGMSATVLAIADMTQPSTARRLYVFDLERRELLLRTFVAHGSGSGDLIAERFSNREGSHQTSLGLYRVGARIHSPKHGAALRLDGLDPGVNDNAWSREVIIHGASYVSSGFIARQGRLGRSWGCPAVPIEDMPKLIDLLADGGMLYLHGART
jgi:hypothetical protein